MPQVELTCIGCPMGCLLTIEHENNQILHVSGHSCKIGIEYARNECTNPTRLVTSTLPLKGGIYDRVPVKTLLPIPKAKINECMICLKDVIINAPVHLGDILYPDIASTGIPIVATQSIPEKDSSFYP